MKLKNVLMIAGLILAAFCITNAKAEGLSDQFKASLVGDMAAVVGHTSHNENKAYLLTSLVQLGHHKGDYILGFDFGGVGSNGSGHLTYGVHVHVTDLIVDYVPMNPTLSTFLKNIELSPRYSYDCDVNHGVLSYVLGAKFSY